MNTRSLVSLRPQSADCTGSLARTLILALTGGTARIAARIRLGCRHDDWERKAREVFLRRSIDAGDLERRQRDWDRDEASGYRLSGWP